MRSTMREKWKMPDNREGRHGSGGKSRPRLLVLGGLSVFFLYAWAGFVFTPMAGDIKIFLANSKQEEKVLAGEIDAASSYLAAKMEK